MRRILVYKYIDIFNRTDYTSLHQKVQTAFNGECPNFGNKLWYQGIISEISVSGNVIEYYDGKISLDEINSTYDCVLYPMANIFSLEFSPGLEAIIDFVEKLKIPVYIISCGVQADSYDDLNTLCNTIGSISKKFITSVYNTGGQFALRGYFTAEFFKKLGFNDAAIVGCPSLFQCGRDLKVKTDKVSFEDFKPSFNGKFSYIKKHLEKYKNSLFYDQDIFYDIIYNPNYFDSEQLSILNKLRLIKFCQSGYILADLIVNDRLRLIADMWDWKNDIIDEKITFSFGSRIHGSVMPLLCGVPSVVLGFDTRTREMAEYYDIPCITTKKLANVAELDLYELYMNTDFSNFNQKFPEKYDKFNDFLVKCGLVDEINSNNIFMRTDSDFSMCYLNKQSVDYSKSIMRKKHYLKCVKNYWEYSFLFIVKIGRINFEKKW